jgi:hypothetical protein
VPAAVIDRPVPPLLRVPPPPDPGPAPARRAPRRSEVDLEALLRWAGIVLVLLSSLFLVRTAISRGWIGPELQLAGATLIGAALLAAAFPLARRRRPWAVTLGTGGVAVLTVCAGAGHRWLGLYGPSVGLILVTAAAAVAVVAAARLRLEAVAVAATAALLIVPTWASIVADAPALLVGAWLALFALAATVVGIRLGWLGYRVVSSWAAAVWVLGLAASLAADGDTGLAPAGMVLTALVGALLWSGPLLTERFLPGSLRFRAVETWAVALVPVWAWAAVLAFGGLDPRGRGGWLGAVLAAGFLALVGGVRVAGPGPARRALGSDLLVAHLLGAGALAAAVTVSWLDGPVVAPLLALQALVAAAAAERVRSRVLAAQAAVLALAAAALLVGDLVVGLRADRLIVGRVTADALTIAALTASGRLATRGRPAPLADLVDGLVGLVIGWWVATVGVPVLDGATWLPVGVALSLAALALAPRLGPFVQAEGVVLGAVTVTAAALGLVTVAAHGGTLWVHLAHLSVVAGLVIVTGTLHVRGPADLFGPLFVVTWVVALGWIGSAFVRVPQGQVVISVAWAVATGGVLAAAIRSGRRLIRVVGLATLAVVLVKLATVDLATVDTLWRVGLFLVVGLGLLRLGYAVPALARRSAPIGGRGDPQDGMGASPGSPGPPVGGDY